MEQIEHIAPCGCPPGYPMESQAKAGEAFHVPPCRYAVRKNNTERVATVCGQCGGELMPTRRGPGGGDLFEHHECPTKSDSVSSGLVDISQIRAEYYDADKWGVAGRRTRVAYVADKYLLALLDVAEAARELVFTLAPHDHCTLTAGGDFQPVLVVSGCEECAERLIDLDEALGKISTPTSANPSKEPVPYISPDEMQGGNQ